MLTFVYYTVIATASSLVLFLILYWSLSLNSSITAVVNNTKTEPVYLWSYLLLTIGVIILFGINVALLTYRVRRYGFPKITKQTGTGLGALVGIAASSCPVCGSVILSSIGITAGLAAFPFQGLELKVLSFGLMALPVWLTTRDLKKKGCEGNFCPVPKNASFKPTDKAWLIITLVLVVLLGFTAWNQLKSEPLIAKFLTTEANFILNPEDNKLYSTSNQTTNNPVYNEVVSKVLPEQGFQSRIFLGDSVVKLVENGVIDKNKFEGLYRERGGLPGDLKEVLIKPSYTSILLTRENANYYVNLLWPLGLSNYMVSNRNSPINGKSLFNFASTGGWNLGKEENGGTYFNKFSVVLLTPEQEATVTKIAQNSYRPCCNNSTFYQDCNHGSALLGLLQLGASQGLSEDELYREALAFNSFWFPHNYIQTALYFKVVKDTNWEDVNPAVVMDKDFSAISNWNENVAKEIAKIPDLLPKSGGGAGCGV